MIIQKEHGGRNVKRADANGVVAPQLSSLKLVDDDTSRLVGLRRSDVNLPGKGHVTRNR